LKNYFKAVRFGPQVRETAALQVVIRRTSDFVIMAPGISSSSYLLTYITLRIFKVA